MNPGLTVRSERSITCALGGRSTDGPILVIRFPSTRTCIGPLRVSETPSNRLPQSRTVAFIGFLPSRRYTRSVRLLSHGKFPAPPDRDEAQPDTKNSTYRGYRRGPGKNRVAKDNNRSA